MEMKIDLKRILWHEMGHFLIDLAEETNSHNSQINDISVCYHHDAISDHKWDGEVKSLPEMKAESTSKDIEKASYTLLSLISGCLFQTYFLREIGGLNVAFNDCFSYSNSSAGHGDFNKFHLLINHIRGKYGDNIKLRIFLEEELNEIYYRILLKHEIFLKIINELIDNYSSIILAKQQQLKENTEFKYSFKEEGKLELLKKELNTTIINSPFNYEIEKLKETIKLKIVTLTQ